MKVNYTVPDSLFGVLLTLGYCLWTNTNLLVDILASDQTHVYTLLIKSEIEARVHSTNYDFLDNMHKRPRTWMVKKIHKLLSCPQAPFFAGEKIC